ncbi:MAG: gamma-glutamylcyclotransferase [Leptolyngbyaceae cyanobacterium]
MAMIQKLFVYGTLGPGRPNEHIMLKIGGTWTEASVTGELHHEGWGAAMGYPGITLDETGENVEGYLFSSSNLTSHWADLDAFEGESYERVLTTAKLKDGNTVAAYIYVLSSRGCHHLAAESLC